MGKNSETAVRRIDTALRIGVSFGRPKVQPKEEINKIYNRWKIGEITAVKAMKKLEIKKTAFY
jgi:hypothetical protein